jgi:hypothetical protein
MTEIVLAVQQNYVTSIISSCKNILVHRIGATIGTEHVKCIGQMQQIAICPSVGEPVKQAKIGAIFCAISEDTASKLFVLNRVRVP